MRIETLLTKYRNKLALIGVDLTVSEIESYVKGAEDVLELVKEVFNLSEQEFFDKIDKERCTSDI